MPLTDDEIVQRLEQAFVPLRCVVTLTHTNQRLDFAVLDSTDKTIVSMEGVILNSVRDEAALAIVIDYMCEKAQEAGHSLG